MRKMNVWYCIPAKRGMDTSTLPLWKAAGYKLALFGDTYAEIEPFNPDCMIVGKYNGYARAVNALVLEVLRRDPECNWIVTGGDDVSPDPNCPPSHIVEGCEAHFHGTCGVMQPTGDRWGENDVIMRAMFPDRPAYIDRICGSPWIGRSFIERFYGGNGPLWPEYYHMYVDEELYEVARGNGVLWQRNDLIHHHEHVMRHGEVMPPKFLRKVYGQAHWDEAKAIFERRKAAGFPEAI